MPKGNKYVTGKKIENQHSLLQLRADGIIEITCNDNHIYEVEDIKENHQAIQSLSEKKKSLVLNLVGKYTSLSNDAKDFIAKGTHSSFIEAEAFVLRSLAHVILARFYVKVSKPKVKTAYFSNEKDAVKWLNSLEK